MLKVHRLEDINLFPTLAYHLGESISSLRLVGNKLQFHLIQHLNVYSVKTYVDLAPRLYFFRAQLNSA